MGDAEEIEDDMETFDGSASIDKVMATGDATAIALLEKFMDMAQEHYSMAIPGQSGVKDVMPALYALNRHLLANFPDTFPSGFFAGDEAEVHEYVGKLLASMFRTENEVLKEISFLSVHRVPA